MAEGDPEEAGSIGDARVGEASSSVVVLVAAVGDGQEPGSGVDIAFDDRLNEMQKLRLRVSATEEMV